MSKIRLDDNFDKFLEGGLEFGIINNLFGPSGTGKTFLCMLAIIDMIRKGKRIIYIDTEGGFSVERFSQIAPDYEKLLEKIIFMKPNTFMEQKDMFEKLKTMINPEIGLIIVDSASMLYRLELGKNDKVYNTNRELGLQISFLNELARKQNLGVIITSHVYSDFDKKDKIKMVGGDFLKYSSKCLIELQGFEKGLRKAIIIRHRSLEENKEFTFKIGQEGMLVVNN